MKRPTQAKPVSAGPKGSADLTKLMKQYGCGPVRFTGTPGALYERHLLFDNVREPDGRRRSRAFRGRSPLRARRPLAAMAAYGGDLSAPELQARLLSLDGVSHRPIVGQQHYQPSARPGRERSGQAIEAQLVRTPGAGTRRGSRQRRVGAPGGLLSRLDGHDANPGHGLWPAVRIRHLQAIHQGRLAAVNSPTTGSVDPTRGRSPVRTRWSR